MSLWFTLVPKQSPEETLARLLGFRTLGRLRHQSAPPEPRESPNAPIIVAGDHFSGLGNVSRGQMVPNVRLARLSHPESRLCKSFHLVALPRVQWGFFLNLSPSPVLSWVSPNNLKNHCQKNPQIQQT